MYRMRPLLRNMLQVCFAIVKNPSGTAKPSLWPAYHVSALPWLLKPERTGKLQ